MQTLEPNRRVQPLFPGSSCFPLSSKRNEKQQNERFGEEFRAETHQLMKIFEVIGTPSHDDVMQLDDGPMKEACMMMMMMISSSSRWSSCRRWTSNSCIRTRSRLPWSCCVACWRSVGSGPFDEIDPEKRITVEEALQSAFVAPVRREENEVGIFQESDIAHLHGNDGVSVRVRRPGVSRERTADFAAINLQRGVTVQVGSQGVCNVVRSSRSESRGSSGDIAVRQWEPFPRRFRRMKQRRWGTCRERSRERIR